MDALKRYGLLLLALLMLQPVLAQKGGFTFDKKINDFGNIEAGDSRAADFMITNTSAEEIYFLRADVAENCVMKYSSPSVKPGETAIVRIQYNPERKGRFTRNTNIYLSSLADPVTLTLMGNVKYIDPNMNRGCPNFNMTVEEKEVKRDFTVQVVDRESMTPIQGAKVHFTPSPVLLGIYRTNGEGEYRNNVPIGLYVIEVTAENYESQDRELYIGASTTSTLFLLDRQPGYVPDTLIAQNEPPRREPEPQLQPEPERKPEPPTEPQPEPELTENPGELSIKEYGPNNIVFLIDVSSSMARPEKLPLLKESMKTLLYSLRSIDRVSIVTYASGTNVVLESTTADKKEEIAQMIDNLTAGGGTRGGKGIREAYKVAEENFIEGGNNQIFLATDGDFNLEKNDNALYRKIRRQVKDGIRISVIGFGNKPKALEKMQTIAANGDGSYIHIGNEQQAQAVLVDEIKLRSKRQ